MPPKPSSDVLTRPDVPPAQAPEVWRAWVVSHDAAGTLQDQPDVESVLLDLSACGAIDAGHLLRLWLKVLKRRPAFAPIWAAGAGRDAAALAALAGSDAFYAAFGSDLARFIIANNQVVDATTEFILTAARRHLLFELTQTDADEIDNAKLGFLCALAQQCFLKEHVYWEEPDETNWVELLKDSLELVSRSEEERLRTHLVALFGCYRPLMALDLPPHAVGALKQVAQMRALITLAIEEPLQEKEIARGLPAMTPIRDAVSARVREQYEESPYPRSLGGRLPQALPCMECLREYPGVDLAAFGTVDAPRILVAGCGTGSNILKFAARYRDAQITAIDLSRASLAYAKRQIDRLGLPVAYAQADILELSNLTLEYDIIECSGVLHHMNDPLAGAKALWHCLRPGGLLRMSVYTQSGRAALAPARDLIARAGHLPTPEGIRRFRRDVMALMNRSAGKTPLSAVVAYADFHSSSMCRDLVFHTQERGYTIPEIEAIARELGGALVSVSFRGPSPPPGSEMSISHMAKLERDGWPMGPLYSAILQKPA